MSSRFQFYRGIVVVSGFGILFELGLHILAFWKSFVVSYLGILCG